MSKKRRTRTLDETAVADEFSDMQNDLEFGTTQDDQVEEESFEEESFVDQGHHDHVEPIEDDDSEAECEAELEGEHDEDSDEHRDFEELQHATEELLDTHEEDSRESASPRRERRTRTRRSGTSGDSQSNRSLLVMIGTSVMVFGFGISVIAVLTPGLLGDFGSNLQTMGLTGGLLVTLGIVVTLVSQALMRQESLRSSIDSMQNSMIENDDYVAECFDYLVDAHEQNLSRRPASGEELEQVLHNLRRQDEKINNLTKALKMYGKPLVEVNRHVTEVGLKTKVISTQVEALKPLVTEMGGQLSADIAQRLSELPDIAQRLSELPEDGTERILENIAALGTKLREEISQSLDRLPKDDGTANTLDALNREVGSLNDAIAKLSLAPRPAAPAPTPAPTPTQSAAPQPSVSQPSASPQPSSPAPDPTGGGSGLAQSISGSKKSSGTGVSGAIAKLKRMRP